MAKNNGSTLFVLVGENRIAKTTSYQLSIDTTRLDVTSNENGFFKDSISKLGSWSLSSSSFLIYDEYSYSDLFSLYTNKQKIWLTIGGETGDVLLGQAFIKSIKKTSPLENVPTISIEFIGAGKIYSSNTDSEKFIIDELFQIIIDQGGNYLIYT